VGRAFLAGGPSVASSRAISTRRDGVLPPCCSQLQQAMLGRDRRHPSHRSALTRCFGLTMLSQEVMKKYTSSSALARRCKYWAAGSSERNTQNSLHSKQRYQPAVMLVRARIG
jgi:hypothetical protein